MAHGPSTQWGKDHAAAYKTRLGTVLFVVYSLVYALFVFLNVAYPDSMNALVGEQNLAVVYGFGLILFAFLLGVVYNHFCTRAERRMGRDGE